MSRFELKRNRFASSIRGGERGESPGFYQKATGGLIIVGPDRTMMKALMTAAMAAFLAAGQAPADALQDYSALIRQATACIHRGMKPPENEVKAAERAMILLLKEREAVTTFIIGRLQSYEVPDTPAALSAERYGAVLQEFGPEYVSRLDPAVLKAPSEAARVAGAYILGACSKTEAFRTMAAGLLADVLKRDSSPAVQAEVIGALDNLRAVDRSDLVAKSLSSEHSEVRRTAVSFYWRFPATEVFDRLRAMLDSEEDPGVGFLLAWTVCRYEKPLARTLLTHRNVGIRCGALYYLADGRVDSTEEDRAAVAGQLGAEMDIRCRYEMAACFRKWKDPRCLGLFINILNSPEDPNRFRSGNVKTAAATDLANLTDLQCGVTDRDRTQAREGGGHIYDGLAMRADAWWRENKERVAWSNRRSKFIIVAKGTDTDAQPALPADADKPHR